MNYYPRRIGAISLERAYTGKAARIGKAPPGGQRVMQHWRYVVAKLFYCSVQEAMLARTSNKRLAIVVGQVSDQRQLG